MTKKKVIRNFCRENENLFRKSHLGPRKIFPSLDCTEVSQQPKCSQKKQSNSILNYILCDLVVHFHSFILLALTDSIGTNSEHTCLCHQAVESGTSGNNNAEKWTTVLQSTGSLFKNCKFLSIVSQTGACPRTTTLGTIAIEDL